MGIGYYRSWEDVDAPVLNGSDQGGLVRLLKTVLVDGYGTGEDHKPGLGWELYEANSETHNDITEMVLKNPAGSGHYLMIDGSGIKDSDTSYKILKTYVRAAESVESYDSGLGLSPPLSLGLGGYISQGYNTSSTATVKWKIFGNARSFWIVMRRLEPNLGDNNDYHKYAWHPFFCGDYDSQYVSNPFNFMTISLGTTSYTSSTPLDSLTSYSTCASYILRNVHRVPGGVFAPLYSGGCDGSQSTGKYTNKGPIGNQDNVYNLNRYSIDSAGYIAGQVPGIYSLQQRAFSGVGLDKVVESADHTLHYLYSGSSSNAGGYFVFVEGKGYDDAI